MPELKRKTKGKNKREKNYSFPYFYFPFGHAVCKAYATTIFTLKKKHPTLHSWV